MTIATTKRSERIDSLKHRSARELAPLLAEARQHVEAGFYRSCVTCHRLFAPVLVSDRRCPDCIAGMQPQIAHGAEPLPS
jgi:hypothetical protein